METAKELRQEGLKVSHVIVFLDRNHGGKSHLENNGIKVHEILQVQAILDIQRPTTSTELRSLVGMVNYYRDMWRGHSHI